MAAECSQHELAPSAHSPPAAAGRPVLRLRGGAIHFGYCTPEQMERMFEQFYPLSSTAGERDATIVPADADSEIAALEAKLTALKAAKAKEGAAQTIEKAPTGADFRDALLVTLSERKVTAAQLQSFFVTHRKCSAAEALADVGSIVAAIDQREKDEAGEKDQEASKKPSGSASDQEAATDAQPKGDGPLVWNEESPL